MAEPINEFYFKNGCLVEGIGSGKELVICFLRHRNIDKCEEMHEALIKISYVYKKSVQYVFVDTI